MRKVILDTSVIIDHLRGRSLHFQYLEQLRLNKKLDLLLPHFVIVELFAGSEAGKKTVNSAIHQVLNGLSVVGLSVSSAQVAGELMRKYSQVPDPFDFLIAAVAMDEKAQIATHNEKHFKQFPGVKLFDFGEN